MFYSATRRGFFSREIHSDIPTDAVEIATPYYEELLFGQSQGKVIVPDSDGRPILEDPQPISYAELSDQEVQDDARRMTQDRLDSFAQTRSYDGILSAATYAGSAVPRFDAEGRYAVEARDATWAALYALLERVEAGETDRPTSWEEVESHLPRLQWPSAS